jgi:hypothetical protein
MVPVTCVPVCFRTSVYVRAPPDKLPVHVPLTSAEAIFELSEVAHPANTTINNPRIGSVAFFRISVPPGVVILPPAAPVCAGVRTEGELPIS